MTKKKSPLDAGLFIMQFYYCMDDFADLSVATTPMIPSWAQVILAHASGSVIACSMASTHAGVDDFSLLHIVFSLLLSSASLPWITKMIYT